MFKTVTTGLLLLSLFLVAPHQSMAQDDVVTPQVRQQKTAEVQRLKTELSQQRPAGTPSVGVKCEVIENRIAVTITRYENNREKHVKRYGHLREVLDRAVNKLEEAGEDTTELEGYLVILDEKIQKFADDSQAFIDALKETQNYDCGESEGMFKEQLSEARSLLQILRDDVTDIKDYYKTVVRPTLQELKDASDVETSTE